MNARPLARRLEVVADDHQASPIKVVGVYADLPSHLLAMGVFRNIARQCSAACEFNESWWSFDMLASASMRSTAVGLAAESDMIWCSTHACKALPKPITEWVEAWLPRRSEPAGALVVLLRCPSNYKVEQSPSRAYLEQLARAAAMELFVQRFDCACGVSLNQAAVPLQIRKQIDEYHPDWKQIRHWGINE
jgi:hypothetical protein